MLAFAAVVSLLAGCTSGGGSGGGGSTPTTTAPANGPHPFSFRLVFDEEQGGGIATGQANNVGEWCTDDVKIMVITIDDAVTPGGDSIVWQVGLFASTAGDGAFNDAGGFSFTELDDEGQTGGVLVYDPASVDPINPLMRPDGGCVSMFATGLSGDVAAVPFVDVSGSVQFYDTAWPVGG